MEFDEDLHSRQVAVYGHETMQRIFASNVLVSGLQGLGAEIAKNLILAGVKSVTLHDEGTVELWDLSSNFIFSESDAGRNRALASHQKLQELNYAVTVSTLTTPLAKGKLSDFQVGCVFTDISFADAVEFDDYCHCHQPPRAFIKAEVRGVFGSVFCDFGPNFTVFDVNGEEPCTCTIASISKDNPALVICLEDEWPGFQDGDLVVFSEIQGMTELNDGKPRKILSAETFCFTLDEDTTKFGEYKRRGGVVTQMKQPKVLNFKPLREALKDPGDFLLSDFSKFHHPLLYHLAFQALDKFRSELGCFPVAGSEDDSQKLVTIVNGINENIGDAKIEDLNQKLLKQFSFGARAILNPMAAMFGGIVGQEVLKACSGKFHPLFQFFYFDSVESLPTEAQESSDFTPLNSRYDAQISVFGHKLQKKLQELKVFLVGSGALGCEFLKNLALMGVACDCHGKLTVTDDDVIEKSNLSGQFLFRDWNIGQAKSTVAAAASINPHLHVKALQARVCCETNNVFDDAFWEEHNVVINALDNVDSRLHVDKRCVYFQKHLLESGTLGAKFHTQVVIPHLTENYGASRDPSKEELPLCRLSSFPHNIDHCLRWACMEFETLLEKTPSEVNSFLSSKPGEYESQPSIILESIFKCIVKERCETFEECVAWARRKFEEYFAKSIKDLISRYPENDVSFGSAPKRFPRPLQFTSKDTYHLSFIMAASILRAQTFGIPIPEWAKHQAKLIEVVDSASTSSVYNNEAHIEEILSIEELYEELEQIREHLPSDFRLKPIFLGKGDDINYHTDLISGLANLRAKNYGITEVDKRDAIYKTGRITPAVATATALASGLVCLELYKVIDGAHRSEDYRNTFGNLALPLFTMAEPVPPKVMKRRGMSWTFWDRWHVEGNPTAKELIKWLAKKGLKADCILCKDIVLYDTIHGEDKSQQKKKIVDLAREEAEVQLPPYRHYVDVEVLCMDDEMNDIDCPPISVYFR